MAGNFSQSACTRAVSGEKLSRCAAWAGSLALVAFMAVTTSVPAQAQFFFHWWDEPVYVERDFYAERYAPRMLGRQAIGRIVSRRGFVLRRPLRRNGRIYVADVRDRRGNRYRLLVDGLRGSIVRSFEQGSAPRPPANIGRRYSRNYGSENRDFFSPRVEVDRRDNYRPRRENTRRKELRKRRTASRKHPLIVSRPLAPARASRPAPAPAPAPGPAQVRTPLGIAPAEPPAAVHVPDPAPRGGDGSSGAIATVKRPLPARPIARVKPQAPVVSTPKPVVTRPANKPVVKPVTTAARPAETTVIRRKPKVRFVRPQQTKSQIGQTRQANRAILPPPDLPAELKLPAVKKSAAPGARRVRIIPLDDPGKRRDIAKPVQVAPLQ